MSVFDPNNHLPKEVIEKGLEAASGALRRCKMTPRAVSVFDCNSLLYGELGKIRFIVYVLITWEDNADYNVSMVDEKFSEEDGSPPPVLIDAARELTAEPHVIRVRVRTNENGTGFSYSGYHEFIESVLSNTEEWNRTLLSGKCIEDFRALVKGRISKLRLEPRRIDNDISFRLTIDEEEPYAGTIDIGALLRSTVRSDEHWIFTCTCGEPGCAGIWLPVIVVNDGPYTLWKAYYAKRRRIFLFDRREYRDEILNVVKSEVKKCRETPGIFIVPYEHNFNYLERALFEADDPRIHEIIPASMLGYVPKGSNSTTSYERDSDT